MADQTPRPLSVAEAKERLRAVAQENTPTAWVRRHPWEAVALAFAAGVVAGMDEEKRRPIVSTLSNLLLQELATTAERFAAERATTLRRSRLDGEDRSPLP